MKPARFLKAASGAALIVLMSTAAPAADNPPANNADNASHTTKKFIEEAWQGNKLEIETSRRALDKSKNNEIRKFAERMIKDHRAAEKQLEDCVNQENLAALMPVKLDWSAQRKVDRLNHDDIKSIDKDYAGIQKDAHDDAVKLFKDYADKGDDATLKSLAASLLPTLEEHQKMAGDLEKSYKSAAAASSIAPAAGDDAMKADMRANDVTNPGNTNPNTDHPNTNANMTGDGNSNDVPTANPTEGKSSPSGGPPY